MKSAVIAFGVGALVGGVVLVASYWAPPGPHFRREMARDSANPAARLKAAAALRDQMALLARAESAYVADSGRPTGQLPPRYGYTKRRSDIAYVRVEQQGWSAMITHARTGMTCTMFAGLNRASGRYVPGQPHCFSELGYDTINVAAARPPGPVPVPAATPDVTPPVPQARPHRDWGPVNNRPPRMPYIVEDACEGEGCTTSGSWAACSTLVVFKDARRDAARVFTILPGERFSALTSDIHVEAPGMLAFRDTVTTPGDEGGEPVDSIRFTPADTLYILNYIGEGYLVWWYRGQAATGYQFWDDSHGFVRGPQGVVVLQEQRATEWTRVRNSEGKEGWVIHDGYKMATGGYMDEIERCLRTTK